jgi:Ca-activated chloride channel homolog
VTVTTLVLMSLLLQRPMYSSHSDLVVVHVSVRDRHAGYVSDLPREAFVVTEDGRPQQIDFFDHEDSPVTIGLVIDSSGSMRRRRDAVITAGMAFAASSNPSDELFTINFNERVWPGLDEAQDFTSDGDVLRRALDRSTARGQTAFFDALAAAMRHLEKGHEARKVLVVVSDGGDNASRTTCNEILDRALRSDIVVYTVGIFDPDDDDKNPKLLKKLAEVTGGEAFFPKTNDDVKPVFERIARDIRSSYTLGYVPQEGRTTEHRLHVDVKDPERRNLSVRARSTYVGK